MASDHGLPPPPSYNEASAAPPMVGYQQPGVNPGYAPPPMQQGYGAPPPQYPPGAYPPPQQGAYPPPQQPAGYGAAPPYGAPPPQPYVQPTEYNKPEYGSQATIDNGEGSRYSYLGAGDVENGALVGIVSFDDKSVRLGFIRKVFGILGLQMAFTTAVIAFFLFHEPTKRYVQGSTPLYISAYVIFFVLYIVLVCCKSVARKHPINMILLAAFTASLSYMVAVISSFYDTKIVLCLFGITMVISVAIMLFACQTKWDITACSGFLFIACLSLFCFGLMAGIMVPVAHMRVVNVVYASLGALLFMLFLAFDTQQVMGGRKHEISPEDHVFGAMMLYVDIIYIFLFLLQIFGKSN